MNEISCGLLITLVLRQNTFRSMKYLLFSLLLSFSITVQSQLITDSVLIEHHYRTFHYNNPAKDIAGGSLVFVLHGSGGSGIEIMKRTTRLESLAGKEKLLVFIPMVTCITGHRWQVIQAFLKKNYCQTLTLPTIKQSGLTATTKMANHR
jgi:poly(3-hydroxybutyrate) depolymerase